MDAVMEIVALVLEKNERVFVNNDIGFVSAKQI